MNFFPGNINYLRKYGKGTHSLGRHNYEFLKKLTDEVQQIKEDVKTILKEVRELSNYPKDQVIDVSKIFPVHTLREIDLFMMDDGNFEKRKRGLYNYLALTEHPTQKKFRGAFIHALFRRELIKKVRWPPNKYDTYYCSFLSDHLLNLLRLPFSLSQKRSPDEGPEIQPKFVAILKGLLAQMAGSGRINPKFINHAFWLYLPSKFRAIQNYEGNKVKILVHNVKEL